MTEPIVACPQCGAKNRIRAAPEGKVPVCGKCHAALPWLVETDDQGFEQELRTHVPVLVDLWAPWCGPCQMVAPVLERLAQRYAGRLKVVKVNVDLNPVTAQRLQVRGIPTLIFFRDGRPVDRITGALPEEALEARLRSYLAAA